MNRDPTHDPSMPQSAEGPQPPDWIDRLASLANDPQRERLCVGDLLGAVGSGSTLVLMLLFALPNGVPVPPGTSAVLGAPLLFFAVQWLLGRPPWLPARLRRGSIARVTVAAWLDRMRPWLARADGWSRPRLAFAVGTAATRAVSAFCVLLALLILLPIPFGNMPPAWAICTIAFGMLRRDGLWVLVGVATGLVAIGLIWSVLLTLGSAALTRLQGLIG